MQEIYYSMTIDCGTQSIRAMIFDNIGNLVQKSKVPVTEFISDKEGWMEIDPELLWGKICTCIKNLKSENNFLEKIEGLTITCQRDSVIFVDSNKNPLTNIFVWMDDRKIDKPRKISPGAEIALKSANFYEYGVNFNRECKAHWIMEKRPEIWEKTYKYLLLSAYLNYKFTGNIIDSTASTVGHIPMDYKNRKWADKKDIKRQIFQIDDRYLYELVEPCSIIGEVSEEVSESTMIPKGTPIIASGSDKCCEAIGSGCMHISMGNISLGSQATVQTCSEKYIELVKLFPSFPSIKAGAYNPEVNVYRGFWLVKWFEDEFIKGEGIQIDYDSEESMNRLNRKLKEIKAGSDGLILQPFWGKEILRPDAKGSIIGFSDKHTKFHVYRAIIEGISFALLEGIEKIEKKTKVKMNTISLSGGGAQSEEICQIIADVFNRKVYTVQTYETSGLGGAVACFTTLGYYKDLDFAVKNMVNTERYFIPNPDNAKKYNNIYNKVYKKIYKLLQPVYEEINKII